MLAVILYTFIQSESIQKMIKNPRIKCIKRYLYINLAIDVYM